MWKCNITEDNVATPPRKGLLGESSAANRRLVAQMNTASSSGGLSREPKSARAFGLRGPRAVGLRGPRAFGLRGPRAFGLRGH
jgi:hypothetical protein